MEPKELIEIAAAAGAKAALQYIERHKREEKRKRHDKRLRNTKLLLKNYNLLRDHSQKSVFNVRNLNENAIDVLDNLSDLDENTYISSIKKSITRTYIIVKHVEEMLALYRCFCERAGQPEILRRCRIIEAYFVDGDTYESIAAAEGVEIRTVYRDIREGCNKLGSLIFGIDGLDDVSKTCQ